MDTITLEYQGQTFDVPVVEAWGPDGKPAELIGDIDAVDCDHAGAWWSSCLELRCARCGAPMFLPPRLLANLGEHELQAMHAAWVRAGWPEWGGDGWRMGEDDWTLIAHPLFAHVGGLAVWNDRLAGFPGARR